MAKERKVLHGQFIEHPVCSMCNTPLTHEWLDGDYTMLICKEQKCWDKWEAQRVEAQVRYRIDKTVDETLKILQGKKE
jgi:hypothetical protein